MVTIAGQFNGPPGSAHGGYASGIVAQALGEGPAEVTLRQPVPIERDVQLVHTAADQVELRDGDQLVAGARTVDAATIVGASETPTPVTLQDAQRAAERFDVDGYAAEHPFPTCFGCGPRREPGNGDGLRIFPGAVGEGQVAWPWVPDVALADDDGLVRSVIVWAVLDCPSGLAWYDQLVSGTAHVLGRMSAAVHRRPAPGEQLVVGGWTIREDGRKLFSGSAIWTAAGEPLAENLATWISLRPS